MLQSDRLATRNITLKLPAETLRKAKILAAERGTSISALLAEKIEELAGEDEQYEAARRHALRWLDRGWKLDGRPASRDHLHE